MKKRKFVLTAVIAATAFAAVAFAVTASETTLFSKITTQGVDISVSAQSDTALIAPGRETSYQPVIENKGMDSYIRFRLSVEDEMIPAEQFAGLSDDWVKKGEYLYLTRPLAHGESVATFSNFLVPADLALAQNSDFTVTKYVDAIQAENFTPDFAAENPWGNVAITESAYDGDSYVNTAQQVQPIVLTLEKDEQMDLSASDVMYSLVPGRKIENTVELDNAAQNPMRISFRAMASNAPLLKAADLKLTLDGTVIYDGDLKAESLSEYKELTTVSAKDKSKLKYEIVLPTGVENTYQESEGDFNWSFKTEEIIPQAESGAPATGDTQELAVVSLVLLGSLAVVITLVVHQKRKEKDGNGKEE